MSRATTSMPIRRSIIVKADPARSFEVFTQRMTSWWNREYTIGSAPQVGVVIEPREGGRWYERGEDGSEAQWGQVLVWDPPSRLVLTWQIDSSWRYDPKFVTELEIRFIPEGNGTRVELEHRHLERYAEKEAELRRAFESPGGWSGLLERYAGEVGAA